MNALAGGQKYKNRILAFVLILATTAIISIPQLHYSIWQIDEEYIVRFAAGFLEFDMNPGWFGYHTLPMYLLWSLYLVLYWVYELFGIVDTKQEFVSFLFSDHAIFYVSGRLLFTSAYILGCYILALIIGRRTGSWLVGSVFFLTILVLPDAFTAASYMRVDNFVYLFLTGMIYFACFSEKNHRNLVLSILCCAAAVASKIPSIVFIPLLFLKLIHDIYYGHYNKKCVLYFIFLFPLFLFLFLPFAFLDFDSYKPVIYKMLNRADGAAVHVGKLHRQLLSEKLLAPWVEIVRNTGLISFLLTFALGLYSLVRDRDVFFAILFPVAFVAEFSTSATFDGYWLRPAYPFFVFFSVILLIEAGNRLFPLAGAVRETQPVGANNNMHISLRKSIAPKSFALVMVYCLFTVFNHNAVERYTAAVKDDRIDNRIIAEDWIKANLPPNSTIILIGSMSQYLPNIYTQDKMFTRKNFFYPRVDRSKIVSNGFDYYYRTNAADDRGFDGRIINGMRLDYDMGEMEIPHDAYVITTSAIYNRFYDSALEGTPGAGSMFRNARTFYSYIRDQELINHFEGKGPTIDIYRMR